MHLLHRIGLADVNVSVDARFAYGGKEHRRSSQRANALALGADYDNSIAETSPTS